jgi:hypothetical protein
MVKQIVKQKVSVVTKCALVAQLAEQLTLNQ